MSVIVRYSLELLVILLYIVCQASCKPQTYRKPTLERREDSLNPTPPTNEVISSQLHQSTTTPPHRRANAGRGAADFGRSVVTKLTSTTLHVAGGNHSQGDVAVGRLDDRPMGANGSGAKMDDEVARVQDLDALIQEIYPPRGAPSTSRHVGADTPGLNAHGHDKPSGKSRPKFPTTESGMIVFPTEKQSYLEPSSPCPDGKTFCADVDNYPEVHLMHVLSRANKYQQFFGSDVVIQPNITQRFDTSGDADELPLCAASETVVYPEKGQNKEDQWLYIVNVKGGYEQGVRIETCWKENSKCEHFENMYGYESFCKQKYIYRKLLAVSPQNGNPIPDSFKLPACCSCHLRRVNSPLARSGFDPATQTRAPKVSRKRRERRKL